MRKRIEPSDNRWADAKRHTFVSPEEEYGGQLDATHQNLPNPLTEPPARIKADVRIPGGVRVSGQAAGSTDVIVFSAAMGAAVVGGLITISSALGGISVILVSLLLTVLYVAYALMMKRS